MMKSVKRVDKSVNRVGAVYGFLRNFAVELDSTAKLGGASAIGASSIAFGLHELCNRNNKEE